MVLFAVTIQINSLNFSVNLRLIICISVCEFIVCTILLTVLIVNEIWHDLLNVLCDFFFKAIIFILMVITKICAILSLAKYLKGNFE